MSTLDDSIMSIIARLAPDRMAAVTVDSSLMDDLGYDSPRKMELVATLESHLHTQLKDPQTSLLTVREVIDWVNDNVTSDH